jgi:hypothetical protein
MRWPGFPIRREPLDTSPNETQSYSHRTCHVTLYTAMVLLVKDSADTPRPGCSHASHVEQQHTLEHTGSTTEAAQRRSPRTTKPRMAWRNCLCLTQQLEGPGPAVYTRATAQRTGQTRQPSHGGHGPCAGRMPVGDCQAAPGNPLRPRQLTTHRRTQQGCRRASDETQPRCGVTHGSLKRRGEDTRATTEAGTRRRPVRWSPTPG